MSAPSCSCHWNSPPVSIGRTLTVLLGESCLQEGRRWLVSSEIFRDIIFGSHNFHVKLVQPSEVSSEVIGYRWWLECHYWQKGNHQECLGPSHAGHGHLRGEANYCGPGGPREEREVPGGAHKARSRNLTSESEMLRPLMAGLAIPPPSLLL